MANGWLVIDVPMDDLMLYGIQKQTRSFCRVMLVHFEDLCPSGVGHFDPYQPMHNNATNAMQGFVEAFPIKAT